jgi:hypothetical protein
MTTWVAIPSPRFVTSIVQVIVPPIVTVPPSGDFVTWMSVVRFVRTGVDRGRVDHEAFGRGVGVGLRLVLGRRVGRVLGAPAVRARGVGGVADREVPRLRGAARVGDRHRDRRANLGTTGRATGRRDLGRAQTKNVIVPGAGPSSPTSVALSWTEPPNATVDALAAVEISSVYASSAEAAGAAASPIDWSSSDSVKSVAQLNVRLRLVRVRRSTRTPRDAMCRPSPDRPRRAAIDAGRGGIRGRA